MCPLVDATTGRRVMQVQARMRAARPTGFPDDFGATSEAVDDAELRFLETPAGQPAAVKTWWYPGNTIGREFIYPNRRHAAWPRHDQRF